MLIHQIGLVSRSKSVDFPSVVRVASALNLQLARDLAPLWQVAAMVVPIADGDGLDPGISPIYIVDDPKARLGFHLSAHNQPYAQVLAGNTWSLAASHEAIEMAVDPSGNRLVAAPGIRVVNTETADSAAIVEYLVEVCGPSMDPGCAYLVDGVLVADFVTPQYFDPTGCSGGRYSFTGRVTRPRQVLPNGRLTWFDPSIGRLQRLQNIGVYEIVELGPTGAASAGRALTGGLALRAFADRQPKSQPALSELAPSDKALQRREARGAFLAKAGPARAALFVATAAGPASDAGSNGNAMDGATPTTQVGSNAVHARRSTDIPNGPADPARPRGDRRKNNSYETVRAAIFSNAASLTLPGILSVRPGLHLGSEGFTNERVVVVKAHPDQIAGLGDQIPPMYGDIRVEVRPADPLERLRARSGATYLQMASARHELRAPVFEDALYLDGSGTTVDDATVAAATMAGQVAKRQIEYAPPPDATLDAISEPVTLVLHVSPDAGWSELSKFLSTNGGNLVVGMHDFGAAHVLQALEGAVKGKGKLTLTLDRPAPVAGSDQSGEEARQTLARDLGPGFDGAWALTNADARSPVWIYPNAYHVKVAVRDDDRFWLSTGDWNNSNLPKLDLADAGKAGKVAATSSRDWHVVVVSKKLADTFRTFLTHDHALAGAEEGKPVAGPSGGAASAGVTALPPVQTEAFTVGRPPRNFFNPKTVTVSARVQPVMTPDNYQPLVLELIESATSSFYMQTQYIHPSGKRGDEDHDALIAAVGRRVKAGVDVRLVMSAYQTDDWMEKLVMQGIPSAVVRRQPGVHNNGIIVDHQRVLIGSQNWSADGTLRNRDAGLIIHDATAAAYFERVFLHDWEHLASAVTGG